MLFRSSRLINYLMDDLAHSVSLPMLTLEELGTLSQVHSSCYHSIWYFVRARYSVRPYLETFFSANEISLFLDAFRRTNAVIGGILPAVVLNCIAAPFGRLELICPSATFDVLHEFLLFANYNCESEQTPSSANLPPLPAHSTYEMGTAIQALFNYSRASTPGITVFVASRTVMETILAGPSTIHQMFISADYLIDLYPKETCIRREIVTWSTSNCLFDPFKLSLNSWIDWGWNVSASPSVVSLLSPNSSFQSHRQVGYRAILIICCRWKTPKSTTWPVPPVDTTEHTPTLALPNTTLTIPFIHILRVVSIVFMGARRCITGTFTLPISRELSWQTHPLTVSFRHTPA
ncbi:hypothetical protein PM082_008814 [Marasmius tenuissimus]|nr:hypothetical protein PM082_008814 [Marasmius tenuissimus]